ncbi:MAG: 23S rRNA (guanosine(2251)-2'-O)-methyltransferase [uncultured Chloroflexi bacterium]|uniref:23S rRNA (Guanosine(2251)-2'-O)-methyltransferase n=1 Tax=uncultured Chloroflexota bacterium TaxID=166587 RepID=A0A6J4K283_9CHLR|nr:MAG: 23S rRNA (guanosine(2251)-2'-O)-methyltransferase [uncultured Chloroflexota bacterium]
MVRLFLQVDLRDRPRLAALARLAEQSGVPVQTLPAEAIEVRSQQALHQGALAEVKPFRYVELEDLVEAAGEREEPLFVLMLDGVEDPQNLGAILRTADAAGVHGVVVPERRAAPVTALVARASAGAVDHVPVAQVTNLNRALDALKAAGAWVYALDMDGEQEYDALDYTGPVVLVAGAEGKGVSRLVRERADGVVRIPLRGKVESLNVSVATSLALYAVRRSRDRAIDEKHGDEDVEDTAEEQ